LVLKRVRVPVPVLTSEIPSSICPEKTVLVLPEPTVSTRSSPEEFTTRPTPESAPKAAEEPQRSSVPLRVSGPT